MKYIARVSILIIAVLSFSKFIPQYYSKIFSERVNHPITFYSEVLNDFIFRTTDGSFNVRHFDSNGDNYTKKEYSSLLPMLFSRELKVWDKYPKSIGGKEIPVDVAIRESHFLRVDPKIIDRSKRMINLYSLFDSSGEYSTIQMPPDLFRINTKVEFIDAATNEINDNKSTLHTKLLVDAGFQFPAKIIAGNSTTRKQYDFGYFILDSADNLYHLFSIKDKPFIRKTGVKIDENIIYITVEENRNIPNYGLIVTDNGSVYSLLKDKYRLDKLSLGAYDPYNDKLRYYLNPLIISITISNDYHENVYITDRSGNTLASHFYQYEDQLSPVYRAIYDTVFPFQIGTDKRSYAGYLEFRFSNNMIDAYLFTFLLTILYLMYLVVIRERDKVIFVTDLILIFTGGIYSLLAIFILDGIRRHSK